MCGGCGFASLVTVSSCPPPARPKAERNRHRPARDDSQALRPHSGRTDHGPAVRPDLDLNGRAPETLYNGITLASPWPPRQRFPDEHLVTPPYLADPPAVIPIDVGRQLFVDDFLIEETTMWRTLTGRRITRRARF